MTKPAPEPLSDEIIEKTENRRLLGLGLSAVVALIVAPAATLALVWSRPERWDITARTLLLVLAAVALAITVILTVPRLNRWFGLPGMDGVTDERGSVIAGRSAKAALIATWGGLLVAGVIFTSTEALTLLIFSQVCYYTMYIYDWRRS